MQIEKAGKGQGQVVAARTHLTKCLVDKKTHLVYRYSNVSIVKLCP